MMLNAASALVFSAGLCWLMLMAASLAKSRGWTPAGLKLAFGNRDDIPEPGPAVARADRAAKNMLEAMPLFLAALLAAHVSGVASSDKVRLGATMFFWARVAYWAVYVAGIPYVRTAVWGVSITGIVLIALAALG
jgi:uncharacterized MAPEG superfamily protein